MRRLRTAAAKALGLRVSRYGCCAQAVPGLVRLSRLDRWQELTVIEAELDAVLGGAIPLLVPAPAAPWNRWSVAAVQAYRRHVATDPARHAARRVA
jgi:hypothetical protein